MTRSTIATITVLALLVIAVPWVAMLGVEWGLAAFLNEGDRRVRNVTFAPTTLSLTVDHFSNRFNDSRLFLPSATADWNFTSMWQKPHLRTLTLRGPTIVYRIKEDGVERTLQGVGTTTLPDFRIETLRIKDGRVKVVQDETVLLDLNSVNGDIQPFTLRNEVMQLQLNGRLQSPNHQGVVELDAKLQPSERLLRGEITWRDGRIKQAITETLTASIQGSIFRSGFELTKDGLVLKRPALYARQARAESSGYSISTAATLNAERMVLTPNDASAIEVAGLKIRTDTGVVRFGEHETQLKQAGCRADTLQLPFTNTHLSCRFDMKRPHARIALNSHITDVEMPVYLRAQTESLSDYSYYFRTMDAPIAFEHGKGEGELAGVIKHDQSLSGEIWLKLENAKLKTAGGGSFLGLSTTMYRRYLQERDGAVVVPISVAGTLTRPELDFTSIRTRVTTQLGIETGMVAAIGLPAFVVDETLRRITGESILGEVRKGAADILSDRPEPPSSPEGIKRPDFTPGFLSDIRRPVDTRLDVLPEKGAR